MNSREQGMQMLVEHFQGKTTIRKLALKYGCSRSTVKRRLMAARKQKQSDHEVQAQQSKIAASSMPDEVKQLKEALRMAELKIALLETMIDISDEEYGTDIRKKGATRQS